MSANMAATEEGLRPQNVTWPPKKTDSGRDWEYVGKYAMSYASPFRLNDTFPATEKEGQLVHGPIAIASVPSWIGTTQARNYTVVKRDDGTYLRIWAASATGDFLAELWWKKLL